MKKSYFCYLDSKLSKKVVPMTLQKFDEAICSERVRGLMKRIEEEPDYEKKNVHKDQLPAAIFACICPEDGIRPKRDTGIASGLCMHDWDHIEEDPRMFYMEHIAGREEQLGIVLVHISPRGNGLRLVSELRAGVSIADCQGWLADQCGMSGAKDEHCKDQSRISFLPSEDYILYRNDERLFEREQVEMPKSVEPAAVETPQVTLPAVAKSILPEPNSRAMTVVEERHEEDFSIPESLTYEGISYHAIITEMLKRLATDGKPTEGERNDDLYAAARELRHLTNYNFETTLMLLRPYFASLPDQELRRTINSAISSNGRTITPTMRGILSQLRSIQAEEQGGPMPWPRLPQVPPVIEMLCSHYPKAIQPQVVIASLPILGTYGTHIRSRYLDNRMHSLSFQVAVFGRTGQGKSFAQDLYEKTTRRFFEMDRMEREKNNQYAREMELGVKGNRKAPVDPRPKVRLYGDDITTNQLLEYLDNLNGEHGLQFTEEVSRVAKARRTRFADNDDIYCKAFDNGIGGKESKSRQTRNVRIPIYLNTLFCGTDHHMHEFYNDPEGGLNNRVIFAALPSGRSKMPKYGLMTEEETKFFEEQMDKLWDLGTHPGEEVFQVTYLSKAIERWIAKCDREDEENPDQTWRDLANRAAVMGYRAGLLAHFLWDAHLESSPQLEKKVVKFALWVAETARISIFNFCGDEYDKLNATAEQHVVRETRNKKLLSLLPSRFTTQEVINQRIKNGQSTTNVNMVIKRWMDSDLIRRDGNCYAKVKTVS